MAFLRGFKCSVLWGGGVAGLFFAPCFRFSGSGIEGGETGGVGGRCARLRKGCGCILCVLVVLHCPLPPPPVFHFCFRPSLSILLIPLPRFSRSSSSFYSLFRCFIFSLFPAVLFLLLFFASYVLRFCFCTCWWWAERGLAALGLGYVSVLLLFLHLPPPPPSCLFFSSSLYCSSTGSDI